MKEISKNCKKTKIIKHSKKLQQLTKFPRNFKINELESFTWLNDI